MCGRGAPGSSICEDGADGAVSSAAFCLKREKGEVEAGLLVPRGSAPPSAVLPLLREVKGRKETMVLVLKEEERKGGAEERKKCVLEEALARR